MTSTACGEKRASPRTSVQLTAHCRLGHRHLKEAVENLSRGGLFLRTREAVKEGAPVRVALSLPLEEGPRICTLVGRVARVHTDARGLRCGVGVAFEAAEITGPDRLALHSFLEQAERAKRSVQEAV